MRVLGVITAQSITVSYLICEAGTYQNGTDCPLCLPGSFSASSDENKCLLCPEGTYVSEPGATACLETQPGQAQPLPGKPMIPLLGVL
jgi:hypothetical protein